MSIYAYVGMPGSGKSYDVVANQIMPALRQGRIVVTNVPLKLEAVRVLCPDGDVREFPTELIASDPARLDEFFVPGCVLVLDEVWRLWPAGQKAHHVPEPFKKLLAEHRHFVDEKGNSTQIVLVTQDLAQIGAFARQLVEQTFYHTKLSAVGARGSYRIDVYHGPRTGPNPPKEARINEQFGRYSKEIFQLYNSHTMSQKTDGTSGANEKTMDGRGSIWKRPGLLLGLVAVVALLAWAVPTIAGMVQKDDPATAPRAASVATRPRSAGGFRSDTVHPTTDAASGRVSAVVQAGADSYAILEAAGRSWRVPLGRCDQTRWGWVCADDGREYTFEAAPHPPQDSGGFSLAKPD